MIETGLAAYAAWRDEYAKATDPARYPIGWLDGEVFSGRVEAWSNGTAGMLARIDIYPTGLREVHCVVAAGDMYEIKDVIRPAVEEWGRAHGAVAAVVESREGWAKVLEPEGYRLIQVKVRKEFSYGH